MTVPFDLGAGLDGRVVVCVGAAGGIGTAAATAFAAAGGRLVLADRPGTGLHDLAGSLAGKGHSTVHCDLREPGAGDRLMATVVERTGSVDVLTQFAAVLRRRTDLDEISDEDWDVQQEVNLRGTFTCARAAARQMRKQRRGRIITVASQGWWTGGFGGSVAYAASKGGVVSLTRGLARTLGPYGITVNCIAPGNVDTPLLTEDLDPLVLDRMLAVTPLGRLGTPAEVAATAVFLASRHASYITGATINVSGGLVMY